MQHLTDPERAAAELASGALLVHPTQGLWGIAADPLSERGMGRLAALKGTTRAGFITVAAGADQLDGWYRDDNGADKLLRTAWRGPVTFVLPAGVRAPAPIIAAPATVALRVTTHTGAANLARALGHGFASTSLNLPAEPPARSPDQLPDDLAAALDAVYAALPEPAGAASTIIDLCAETPRLLRAGAVGLDDILTVLAL